MTGSADAPVRVEVLYVDGCPGHRALLPRLPELLAASGRPAEIEQRRIPDAATAERERFLGSPTVRVDGVDVDPGAAGRTDFGLKCRLYATPDGLRPTPPEAWLLDALSRRPARGGGPARG